MFGQIKDIIILPSEECVFVVTPIKSVLWNTRLHSFEVLKLENRTLLYRQNDLADFHPLTISKTFRSSPVMFVRLKYSIVY